ncbi:polyprenyl synthetase family protein [Amycolatopsis sp. cg5]|uniref:polyprenyl synthetase family protein n=1 Tax=Amycolatopsis sp. cg5 TaxID=3238802 RepID=UPI0035258284
MVTDLLAAARRAVEPVLRHRVDTLPARMRLISGYHFGWWDGDGTDHEGGTGKTVRPALVYATARALNLATDKASVLAAGVELVHNFTLVHDDVHDQDVNRHGQPAAWTVYGEIDALLAGNALLSLGLETLAQHKEIPPAAAARLARCAIELCEGQSMDLAFERRSSITLDECLAMSARKTGVLLGCACAVTALTAGAAPEVVAALDDYGVEIGIAFQFANDLLGIWGDERIVGKPTGSDLTRLKKTLPIVHALESEPELAALYATGVELSSADSRRAVSLVARSGAREWAEAEIRRRLAVAHGHLDRAFGGDADLSTLADLALRYYQDNRGS